MLLLAKVQLHHYWKMGRAMYTNSASVQACLPKSPLLLHLVHSSAFIIQKAALKSAELHCVLDQG